MMRMAGSQGALGRGLARLVAAAATAGIALGMIGRLSPVADIASHFTGHLIAVLAGAALALALCRHELPILLGSAILAVAAHGLLASSGGVPIPAGRAHATGGEGRVLEVLSLNAWHDNRTPERVAELIEREDADIVLLYEVGPEKSALMERLGRRYRHVSGCHDDWRCAVAILSKEAPRLAAAGGHGHHDGAPRVAIRLGDGKGSLTVIGAHLIRPIDDPWRHRLEIDQLAAMAQAAPGAVIVAGDFNATPWSAAFARFRERSGLVHMGSYLPSWPAGPRGVPQLAIDHVWASPGIAFESVVLGADVGSDHRPLVATLRAPER